jgi:hypothetical protein
MEWQQDSHGNLPFDEWKSTKQLQQPADPFTIQRVDPRRIDHVTVYTDTVDKAQDGEQHPIFTPIDTRFAGFFRTAQAGTVRRGNWDKTVIPFDEYIPYVGLRKHFCDNVDWESTQYYQNIVDCITAGNPLWGCETEAEFRERCANLDQLYDRIDREGYRPANDLHDGKLQYDEVAVNIGRDGQLLFNDGKHRLSIARLLRIDTIPVRVIARHQQWVANHGAEFPSVNTGSPSDER